MAFKSGTTLADAVEVITNDPSLGSRAFSPASSQTLSATEVKITASDGVDYDYFGSAVAVGNGRIVVSAYGDDDNGSSSGSAYIFDLDGNQLTKITASDGAAVDNFGTSVAIGHGRIVVGAALDDDAGSASGSAYIFDLDGNQLTKITASDGAGGARFGTSVTIGSGRIVVGASYDQENGTASGAAYIFDLDGTQLAKITASDGATYDYFGHSVAVGNGRIAVGAYGDDDNGSNSGSAYIFDLNGNQLAKITASDGTAGANFGVSAAVGCGRIVIGASFGNTESVTYAGLAYIFDLNGNQLAKIAASDPRQYFTFGASVAVKNGKITVGSYANSSMGGAYLFDLDGNQLDKITSSDGVGSDHFGKSVTIGNGRMIASAERDDDNGVDSGSVYIYDFGENYDSYIEDVVDVKQI